MRKNVYNSKILMVRLQDFYAVAGTICQDLLLNKELFKRYQHYRDLILEELNKSTSRQEFGILVQDEVDLRIQEILEETFASVADIHFEQIQNAYLAALLSSDVLEAKLKEILLLRNSYDKNYLAELDLTRKEICERYGEDTLDYILAHGKYFYPQNYDFNEKYDEKIMLCHDGVIEECVVNHQPESEIKR